MVLVPILGIMVTRGGRWVIHSWLHRHAAMFERLAVLDGSPPGSTDAAWTEASCRPFANVVYQTEASIPNLSLPTTDQTSRAAAMRMLFGHNDTAGKRTLDEQLEGRWILNAHPDEYFLQDVRGLLSHVERRDPLATCVLFGAAYVVPTRAEFEAITRRFSGRSADGHAQFEPYSHLRWVDAEYRFKEPRLWKFVPGTRWGTRHSITTPEVHPGHRIWPTRRDVILGNGGPFFVHLKIHDFSEDAFSVVTSGCGGGVRCSSAGRGGASAAGRKRKQPPQSQPRDNAGDEDVWIAFNRSGFATGLAPHHTHGKLKVNRSRPARETVLSYYELSGRPPVSLAAEIRRRCARLVPRCTVQWSATARFA